MVFWQGELLKELTVRLLWCFLHRSSRVNVSISFWIGHWKCCCWKGVCMEEIGQCVWTWWSPFIHFSFEAWKKEFFCDLSCFNLQFKSFLSLFSHICCHKRQTILEKTGMYFDGLSAFMLRVWYWMWFEKHESNQIHNHQSDFISMWIKQLFHQVC